MSKIIRNKVILILGVIFLLGTFLRFYSLSEYPVGFHIDEASLGYNAYSLLLTGKDDNGNSLPLYIDMFGDNRPSGYHYLTIVPVKLFGLNEFSTRFSAALFGSLSILSIYFFTQVLLRNTKVALVSSLLFALSPWHIVLSRASSEAVVALFFVITGFVFIYKSILHGSKNLFLSAAILIVSFFFYHTPRIFVPLMFLVTGLYLLSLDNMRRNYKRYSVAFFGMLATTLLLIFLIKGGTGRFAQVNIFSSFETDFFLKQEIQEDTIAHSNKYISRFFHNKLTNYFLVLTESYLDYFSTDFLFVKGGLPIWYNVPRMGLIYLIELPFFLYGLFYLIKQKEKISKIPLVWLIFAPLVPSITTDDVPNVNRAVQMIPALVIISATGFVYTCFNFRKKMLTRLGFVTVLLFTINSLYFLHQYYINAKVHKPWFRNNGFKEMMKISSDNYGKYDKIMISKVQGGIYPLVLFYSLYDPYVYQAEGSLKSKDNSGFGKYYFHPHNCPTSQLKEEIVKDKKILFIESGDCINTDYLEKRTKVFVKREDGTKAFRIIK